MYIRNNSGPKIEPFASNAFPIAFYRITEVGNTRWIVHPPYVMIIILLIITFSVSDIEYWVMVGYNRP